MGVKTIVIDRGAKRFRRELSAIAGSFVDIGIMGGRSRKTSTAAGTSIAEYALHNEFGTKTIPERSFFRSTVQQHGRRYNQFISKGFVDISLGRRSALQTLTELGVIIKGDIKRRITDIKEPRNTPSTRLRKGSSNPLIDTGAMRNAIQFEVKGI